jgi:hypothetical protein
MAEAKKAVITVTLANVWSEVELRNAVTAADPEAVCEQVFPKHDDPELAVLWTVTTVVAFAADLAAALAGKAFVVHAQIAPERRPA